MSRGDFWSRRKDAVAAEETAALEAETEAALAERPDEEILEELGLDQPEELETPDAVREFLNSAVPQRLKTRALRRLWRLNPVLANLDGLVDYGEDFTDAATVVENLQTAYQVGKGMLSHLEFLAEKAAREAEAEDAPQIVPEDEPEEDDVAMALADAPEPAPLPEPEEDLAPAPARRRMTFHFDPDAAPADMRT